MLRITIGLSLLMAGLVSADEPPPMPKTSPLTQGTARLTGENLLCGYNMLQYREVQQTVRVVKCGQVITETRTTRVPYNVFVHTPLPLKGLRGHVVGDPKDPSKSLSPLDVSQLPELLRNQTRVFFVPDGQRPSPDQVKELKAGTVILFLPQLEEIKSPQKK
jgi:hypothetical protein